MTALIRRTPLAALLRQPHQPRRDLRRPRGHRPEHRINSGPRRNCARGLACPCRVQYAPGVAPVAPIAPASALLAQTMILPTVRGAR